MPRPFPFYKMVTGMLDPEMIEDTAKIVNEAIKDKIQMNLIINNRAGGNAPITDFLLSAVLDNGRKEGHPALADSKTRLGITSAQYLR